MPRYTNTRLSEVANHFDRPIKNGEVSIPCPAHLGDDDNCSVREGTRGADIVATCHSRHCDSKDIVKAIRAALGKDSPWKAAPIAKPSESPSYAHSCGPYCSDDIALVGGGYTYEHREDYVDAAGDPQKKIWQEKGAGPSYLKILEQDDADNAVTICEGKKDAYAVWAAGLNAAFWLGGTGGVQKQYFTPAQGKDIILWPDKDEAGEKAMQQVAFKCEATNAASIRMVQIPEDFAPKGHGAADCDADRRRSLIAGAVEWVKPADVQASSAVDRRPFEITSESFAARFH